VWSYCMSVCISYVLVRVLDLRVWLSEYCECVWSYCMSVCTSYVLVRVLDLRVWLSEYCECVILLYVRLYFLCFSESADSTLLKFTSPLIIHSSDAAIGSLTGSSTGSIGMPCTSNSGVPGGSSNVINAAGAPPQFDISFIFADSNKLAKNAKRSYESQVCDDQSVDTCHLCFSVSLFIGCYCFFTDGAYIVIRNLLLLKYHSLIMCIILCS